jgi:hypothetical protein
MSRINWNRPSFRLGRTANQNAWLESHVPVIRKKRSGKFASVIPMAEHNRISDHSRSRESLKRVRLYAKITDLSPNHPLIEEIYDYSTSQLVAIVKRLEKATAKGQ